MIAKPLCSDRTWLTGQFFVERWQILQSGFSQRDLHWSPIIEPVKATDEVEVPLWAELCQTKSDTCNLKIRLCVGVCVCVCACVRALVCVCCRMSSGPTSVLRGAMGERAPCGLAQKGPTHRATWTPTAVTWYYRCKDGKMDHSMCLLLFYAPK